MEFKYVKGVPSDEKEVLIRIWF